MNKVLILGAGLVTRPHVVYLLNVPELEVTVASRTVSKAEALVDGHPRGKAIALNVKDDAALESLIRETDLAVSMLPYIYHPKVAALCVKHKKHMVTTSYVKDEMRALDGAAREAGVILLNEIGVDPGIDHMSAMKVIHGVEAAGGRIASFVSWCGGLPAPEANDNPFGYKFSWSPKGVLLAGRNPARFQKDGQVVEIPGGELFDHYWPVHIPGLGEFEGYPNRDSLPYADVYDIEPDEWMFRGTLRNVGWCATLKKISDVGLLEETALEPRPRTYRELLARLLGVGAEIDLRQHLAERWGLDRDAKPLADVEWLGLFADEAAEYPDRREAITATMIDYGIPYGDSSMSRTVGLPAAIAARMILQGEISGPTGVQVPVIPEIYEPVLAELENVGISLTEKVEVLSGEGRA
jgi:saccharopine dehydrogenase (NADP+, L-glutamate forming)